MTAEELRRRVEHDVGAVLDRPAQVRRDGGGVDDQRDAVGVSDVGGAGDVEHVTARVGDDLGEEQLRRRRDRRREIVGLAPGDERRVHPEAAQRHVELGHGAAVQPGGRHDVVAGSCEGGEGEELGRLTARRRHRADPALEARHPFLEGVDRRDC